MQANLTAMMPSAQSAMPSAQSTIPWVEKYRPTQFDDIVLDPLNRTFFKHVIDKAHFPNMLFYGPPGTGKTTTIMNLINEYQDRHTRRNKETVIHLNASDERGVDIIRSQIYQFVRSHHIFESGCKFVILDEVDYMTKNAQQALKTLLQTCHQNVRFCLICNYISKIDESLQREFICVRFNQLPQLEIRRFVRKIAESERIRISDDEIEILMSSYQSDIRSMINFMQAAGFSTDDKDDDAPHPNLINNVFKNAISVTEWNQLHEIMTSTQANLDTVTQFITRMSVLHNTHAKQILLGYMSQIIRKHLHLVTSNLIDIFERTSHSSDDMPVNDVVRYFVANIASVLRQ